MWQISDPMEYRILLDTDSFYLSSFYMLLPWIACIHLCVPGDFLELSSVCISPFLGLYKTLSQSSNPLAPFCTILAPTLSFLPSNPDRTAFLSIWVEGGWNGADIDNQNNYNI